ncbi:pentapeptide repeat-containing protein [Phaeodactylibacter xiamenensis]|uniref:pentapeptide repeat-containing protein n=1 Tax=Phaeodactylibacter xiamenensis TaxID=1524460 RepID=UPI003CCC1362
MSFRRQNIILVLAVVFGLIAGGFLAIFRPDFGLMLRNLWSAVQGSYIEAVEALESIAYLIGAAVLILLPVYLFLRLYYGKGWLVKTGIRFGAGKGLMGATKTLVKEANKGELKKETIAEFGVHIFWRLTRIGLIGLFLALIPIWLLYNQNRLITKQNTKIDLQNNLIEADRRSALILLMSNVLDQVNSEIEALKKEDQAKYDSTGYNLSDPLIGRIAALSQGFIPYRFLTNGTLTEKAVSPERGQLLLALTKSNLDSITSDKVNSSSKFEGAYFSRANLSGADLSGADLSGADFIYADLSGADLSGADLSRADFIYANLSGADLSGANLISANLYGANLSGAKLIFANPLRADLSRAKLSGANLRYASLFLADLSRADLSGANLISANLSGANLSGANLSGAINLNVEQLKKTYSLHECLGLDLILVDQLRKEKPCLFTKEGCKE